MNPNPTLTRPLMKLIPALALTTALLAHGTVLAQGPRPPVPPLPPGNVIPPRPPHPPAPPSAPREPVTFLGLVAAPAARALTEQLGLPLGFGLVVESVVPDSPAAAAGVQPYDLLQMLNDQKLVGPEQLGALVRGFPEGTTVSLTLLRKGQEQKLTAKLVRNAAVASRRGPRDGRSWADFMPRDFLGGAEGSRNRNRVILRRSEDHGAHGTAMNLNNAHLILKDETGEVEVVTKNGKREVTARRPDGSVIYSGPVESEEERRKLPEDALKKLDRLSGTPGRRAPAPPSGDNDKDEDEDDLDFIFEDGFTQPLPPPPRPADAANT